MTDKKDFHPLNRAECPHCGLWFKLEDIPSAKDHDKIKCPYCDWLIENPLS